MPKQSFGDFRRLIPWESHLLDFVIRFPFGVTIKQSHEFLLDIYECDENSISLRDVRRSFAYLFSLGLIKQTSGKYYPTDSGVSSALWIFRVNSLKQERFLQSSQKFLIPQNNIAEA